MRRLITGRRAGILAALVAVLGSAATTASAHVAAKPVMQIRHIAASQVCPLTSTICVFSQANFQGFEDELTPIEISGQWSSFGSIGVTFHPASAINNSGSTIWVHDEQTEQFHAICSGGAENFGFSAGYFFVQYGVPGGCYGSHPGGAP
jgi:hypothetical protein